LSFAVALAALLAFTLGLQRFGVVPAAAGALATLSGTLASLRDPAADDRARELAARRGALLLLRAAGAIGLRSLGALLLSLAPVLLADAAGWSSLEAVGETLTRWELLVAGLLLFALLLAGNRGAWRPR
jgi:hypothetical protein